MSATLDNVFAKPMKNGKRAVSKKVDNNTYAELRVGVPDSFFSCTVAEWEAEPQENRAVAIRLHQTDIVTWVGDGRVRLDTGGWKSVTTKARINDWLPVGSYLSSVKGEWRVVITNPRDGGGEPVRTEYPYADGITLVQGEFGLQAVAGTYPSEAVERQLREARAKLRKDIKAYVAKLPVLAEGWKNQLLDTGRVNTTGDCLYCQGIVTTPDGQQAAGNGHLWSHLREGYIPVTLVLAAYRAKGYQRPEYSFAMHLTHMTDQMQKIVSAYLLKELGESSEPTAADSDRVRLQRFVSQAVDALQTPEDFGYFGGDTALWNTSAPTWTKHRDSDKHDVANFEVVWNTLAAEFPELVPADLDDEHYPARDFNGGPALYVFGAGHWAVGHIDQIVVPVKLDGSRPVDVDNLHPAFIRVCELGEQVAAYPVLPGAEPIVARLEAEEQDSEVRQYLEDPTDEQVALVIKELVLQHGEYPDYLDADEWVRLLDDMEGVTPAAWLDRYRETAE